MCEQSFQDLYPEDYTNCYGSVRNNEQGLHLKSSWAGEKSVCRHTPKPQYSGGFPGFVYGGMIASLLDCHGAGIAAKALENNEPIGRFVTALIKVDYLKPILLGVELEVCGKVVEIKDHKVVVDLRLLAEGILCATGTVIVIQNLQK